MDNVLNFYRPIPKRTFLNSKIAKGSEIRIKLEKASDRIHSLEHTLKEVKKIREKRKYFKDMHNSCRKLQNSLMLKHKIKKIVKNQELKLRNSHSPNKETNAMLPTIRRIYKSSNIMDIKKLNLSLERLNRSPKVLNQSFKLL